MQAERASSPAKLRTQGSACTVQCRRAFLPFQELRQSYSIHSISQCVPPDSPMSWPAPCTMMALVSMFESAYHFCKCNAQAMATAVELYQPPGLHESVPI